MSALETYAAKIQGKQAPEWVPPTWDDFKRGLVVASFDQTFTTTGYVCIMIDNSGPVLLDRGTWKPWSDASGFEMAYEKTALLENLLMKYLYEQPRDRIVYEMPVVAGHRKESSFLAGYVFAREGGVAISIQHSRAVLAGPGTRNDKKAGHRALINYIPSSASRQWNEHQRDAALNALGHLYDVRKQDRERRD